MVFQVPEEELEACPLPEWVFLLVTVKEDFAVWETDVRAAAWVGRVPVRSVQDRQRHAAKVSRRNSRVFCELCSQKTPRGTLPVNSN